mmetsp:Transcript_18111/g.17436  ORF Transcript_18111/g.17436 Transcript_18111/m.17436 type:complete len:163 (+) Transcript_18111:790-1278(+)
MVGMRLEEIALTEVDLERGKEDIMMIGDPMMRAGMEKMNIVEKEVGVGMINTDREGAIVMSTDGEGVIVMSIDREGAIALSTDRAGAVVVAALMKGVEIEINVLTVEKGLQVEAEAEAEAETMIDLDAGVETVIDLKRIIIAQTMMLILYLKYRPYNWPIGF